MLSPKAALILTLLIVTVACGGKPTTTSSNNPTGKQLDPQGNWLFVVTNSSGNTLTWGEELFEVSPPALTANSGLGWVGQYNGSQQLTAGLFGAVSGTNTIAMTVCTGGSGGTYTTSCNDGLATLTLNGTIADDQQHMSGTWTQITPQPELTGFGWSGTSGTWTAQLITAVTGTYSGTLTQVGSPNTIAVSMSLTEDVSQTDSTMGQVTGTMNISGSPCFNSSTALTIASEADGGVNIHVGELLQITTVPDGSGQSVKLISGWNGTDPNTANVVLDNFSGFMEVTGGSCDGQRFTGTLVHN